MNQKYNVYLVSDSTGETLDRIFFSLKSQFSNFEYEKKQYVLTKLNHKKIVPYQKESFKQKAKFIRKVLNLLVIS